MVEEIRHQIISAAQRRWFLPDEVELILSNNTWELLGFHLSHEPPTNPLDGHLYLFDRSQTTRYKNDGVQYSLKKKQDRIQESYHNFKINGVERISGVYCRGMHNKNFCRRIYRLMDDSPIVFVHYRESASDDLTNQSESLSFDWKKILNPSLIIDDALRPRKRRSGSGSSSLQAAATAAVASIDRTNGYGDMDVGVLEILQSLDDDNLESLSHCDSRWQHSLSQYSSDVSLVNQSSESYQFYNSNSNRNLHTVTTLDRARSKSSSFSNDSESAFSNPLSRTSNLSYEPSITSFLETTSFSFPHVFILDFSPSKDICNGGTKILVIIDREIPLLQHTGLSYKVCFGSLIADAEFLTPTVLRTIIPQSAFSGRFPVSILSPQGLMISYPCQQLFEYLPSSFSSQSTLSTPTSTTTSFYQPPTLLHPAQANASADDLSNQNHETENHEKEHKLRIVEKLGKAIIGSFSSNHDDSLMMDLDQPFLASLLESHDSSTRIVEGMEESVNEDQPQRNSNESGDANAAEKLLRVDSSSSSIDPSSMKWLSDAELSRLSPTQLENIMDVYVSAVVKQLVHIASLDDDLKVELDSLDTCGYSLLHYCCMYNLTNLIPSLLAKNVSVNLLSGDGKTALHLAIESLNVDIINLLLNAGADESIVDSSGITAAEKGLESNNPEIVKIFTSRIQARGEHISSISETSSTVSDAYQNAESYLQNENFDFNIGDQSGSGSGSGSGYSSTNNIFLSKMSKSPTATESRNHSSFPINSMLLYQAFSSLSLADKCALSISLGQHPIVDILNSYTQLSQNEKDDEKINTFDNSDSHSTANSIAPSSAAAATATAAELGVDMEQVLTASDKESLDVAMSMMGQNELNQLENEVKIIQANVRTWLLRKNYMNLRDSAKVLQGFWRERKKTSFTLKRQRKRRLQSDMLDEAASPIPVSPTNTRMISSIQQQKREEAQTQNAEYDERQTQAAATLQAATRGMIVRKSFRRIRKQAMASLVIQNRFINWWHGKSYPEKSVSET